MNHLILAGFRGTGKSTVAVVLAKLMELPLQDLDTSIQQRVGKPISEIFGQQGESGFRAIECQVLKELVQSPRSVISLGGGAVKDAHNRKLIGASGVCVWLTASIDTIVQRIGSDSSSATLRPALSSLAPRDEVETLLREREPLYREVADLIVDTDGKSPEQVADEIISKLPERLQ